MTTPSEQQCFLFSHVFRAATSNQSVPTLHVDKFDWDAVPPKFKKEGSDWFTVSNPKTERVLDLSPVRTLIHDWFVSSPSSVSTIQELRFLAISSIFDVRFSADGKYLATSSRCEARIYDAETGIQIWFGSLHNSLADGTPDTDWLWQPLG